jgi:diaminohydroxyphosphoribosylaminopyrimidine deaminase/5-amino-6-(5-phosphoribosylamino)uracil reductase
LDGKTALLNGRSQWITGAAARRDVHRLRSEACAVLTGIGTVRADDPQLTVREVPCARQPWRVVIDSRLEIDDRARVLEGGKVILATSAGDGARAAALRQRGIEVLVLPQEPIKGKADLGALVRALAERGINLVMVEAGARLNASLLAAGLLDEIVLYTAPSIVGDLAAGLFALPEMRALDERIRLAVIDQRRVGEDWRVTARLGGR